MDILCMCPANYTSGGPETLHKLVSDLNKVEGVNAKLLYVGKNLQNPQPDAYKNYACPYVTEMPRGYRGVVIIPEIWANSIISDEYRNCTKVIYWLSVDNYKIRVRKEDEGIFTKDKSILHMVQSLYVKEYVYGIGATQVFEISEPVNEEFFKPYEESTRSDVILYNPNKMTKFEEQIIKEAEVYEGMKFEPLIGLSLQQMAEKLRSHKLYIDFGPFPGRERIPREAVLSGCCLITGKNGASMYFEDVSILSKYKFESESSIRDIITTMKYVLAHYSMVRQDFDFFRSKLIKERAELPIKIKDLVEVLNEIQHNHTSI